MTKTTTCSSRLYLLQGNFAGEWQTFYTFTTLLDARANLKHWRKRAAKHCSAGYKPCRFRLVCETTERKITIERVSVK